MPVTDSSGQVRQLLHTGVCRRNTEEETDISFVQRSTYNGSAKEDEALGCNLTLTKTCDPNLWIIHFAPHRPSRHGLSHVWIYVSTKSLIKNSKSSWTCSFFNKIIALQCSIYHSNEKPNKRVIFSQSGSHLNFISVWNYFYMPKYTSWRSLSVALLLKHWNYLILHQHSLLKLCHCLVSMKTTEGAEGNWIICEDEFRHQNIQHIDNSRKILHWRWSGFFFFLIV